MRVLLALVGVVVLAYFVADRVRQLPSHPVASVSQDIAVAAPLSQSSLKAVASAAEPPTLHAVEPPASKPDSRMHPVALVSLDPAAAHFPAQPSDPVSGFALVLPAPAGGDQARRGSRWWEGNANRDWTSDLMHLRVTWPDTRSQAAVAEPADLPSSPASVGSIPAGTAAPAEADAAPVQVTSAEAPTEPAEPADRGLPESTGAPAPTPTVAAPAAAPTTVPATETPPLPVARSEASARAASGPAPQPQQTRQSLPPPPRQLASAAPKAGPADGEDERPSLVCGSSVCGPRLLLLGVGF